MVKMFKKLGWFWKFYKVMAVIMILITLIVFVPILIKYQGRIMIDLGVYNGSEYAFRNTHTNRGVFRKSEGDKDFVKISEYVPLGDKYFFFNENTAIFTTREYNIVKIYLDTLEEKYYKYPGMALSIIGLSGNYIIAVDGYNNSYIKIIDFKTMEIIDSIDMVPYRLDISVKDAYFEFEDYKSRERYKYFFDEKRIVKNDNES